MNGLRFRETNIIKIIKKSFAQMAFPGRIGVSLISELEDETVWMDDVQIVSVLVDLERNAAEAMTEGGTLTVSVSGDEHNVTVWIMDTGKGISEENMPLLFTPFYTTKPVGDGTGLGLPQAFAIVKAHHGNISITSNADPQKAPTGTTVKITLPRRQTFQVKEASIILHDEE